MADIYNDQYLHRPGRGRGAITPADPFEVLLYDGLGNPLLVKTPTGETRQALGVAGYGYDGTNWRPVKVNASGQAEVQLSGSIVEDLNGGQAVRVKQAALAYDSFDFNGSALVTVTAGAELIETNWRSVNGFGTLRYLFKRQSGEPNHPARLNVYWNSTNTSTAFQAIEVVFDDTLSTVTGTTATKSQWMRFGIHNRDTVDHQYHCHGMMTAG